MIKQLRSQCYFYLDMHDFLYAVDMKIIINSNNTATLNAN